MHQLWITSKELEFKIKNSLTYIDDICEIDDEDSLDENDLNTFTAKKYISVIKYLKKEGFQFIPGAFLLFTSSVEVESSVGKIKKILNVDDHIYFHLQIFKIKRKIQKLNCLEILPTECLFYLDYDHLIYKQINFCINFQSRVFLPIRYFHHLI
jgi:hypothetical protein